MNTAEISHEGEQLDLGDFALSLLAGAARQRGGKIRINALDPRLHKAFQQVRELIVARPAEERLGISIPPINLHQQYGNSAELGAALMELGRRGQLESADGTQYNLTFSVPEVSSELERPTQSDAIPTEMIDLFGSHIGSLESVG